MYYTYYPIPASKGAYDVPVQGGPRAEQAVRQPGVTVETRCGASRPGSCTRGARSHGPVWQRQRTGPVRCARHEDSAASPSATSSGTLSWACPHVARASGSPRPFSRIQLDPQVETHSSSLFKYVASRSLLDLSTRQSHGRSPIQHVTTEPTAPAPHTVLACALSHCQLPMESTAHWTPEP